MENYIFIIIAIVLSVFGAMNRSKKKEAGSGQEGNRPSSVFDGLFEDPVFREEEPEVKPAKAARHLSTPQPVAPKGMKAPGINRTPIREKKEIVLNAENKREYRIHPVMKDFSLKKAVVYSEILKRKY